MILRPSVFLALLSMVGVGISDVLYKRARMKGATPSAFLALQAVLFNATNMSYASITGSLDTSLNTIIFGAIAATLVYSSLLLYLRSLSGGELSINAPLFRINFVFTAALGVLFLGESLTPTKLVGLGLAVLAIFSFSGISRRRGIEVIAFIELIIAMLLFGSFGYVYRLALLNGSDPVGIIVFQGFFFISYAFINAWLRGELRFRRAETIHAPICGFLLSSSFLMLLYSISIGEISISVPIMNLSFILSSILGIVIWRESMSLIKGGGLVSSIISVLVLAS